MKGMLLVWLMVLGVSFVVGNEAVQAQNPSLAEEILAGEHQLQAIAAETARELPRLADYLVPTCGDQDDPNESVLVWFSWITNDGFQAFSALPLGKIRVKTDVEVTQPTIKFRWLRFTNGGKPRIPDLMDNNVIYAVVTFSGRDTNIFTPAFRNCQ